MGILDTFSDKNALVGIPRHLLSRKSLPQLKKD